MELTELTAPEAVFPALKATSKKSLFQEFAHRMATLTGVDSRELFAALLERERLGSTGVGRGVAIPHCRIPGVDRIHGAIGRLETPIDFEAVDSQPVDLVYLLIAPECAGADHLKALARVSRLMRDATVCQKLRGAHDASAIYALIAEPSQSQAA